MKKNIAQDVIPPPKTIRNVELLYKSKRLEKIEPTKSNQKIEHASPTFETPTFSYKYEYDEPVKHSKKVLHISISFFVLALFFAVSLLFKNAEISITPKNEVGTMNENFKALKDVSSGGLEFQIVPTTKDLEKRVLATDEEKVEKKSSGTIVVYNNFSTQSQVLIKTTRFETLEGLIFRATENIIVPGTQVKNGKIVAGSVEVLIEADKSGPTYNISLKDFTIPGFKGTPKYTKIYARSKTEMTGGFSGIQKTVSKESLNKIDGELEILLKESLLKDIVSQIPENFILYEDTISYKPDPSNQVNIAQETNEIGDTVVVKKKGSIKAVIFDKGSLSRAIISKILPDAVDSVIKIINLGDLNFTFTPGILFDSNISTSLSFNLTGEANFVWVIDENKLKTELLGMSKKSALVIVSKYDTIKEAEIKFQPFWGRAIPKNPEKVTLTNTLAK